MAIEVKWSAAFQEFYEEEVPNKKSPRYYEWRRSEIARMIVNEGMTVRDVASIFGVHNCNIYRAIGGRIGGIYSDVQEVWKSNKRGGRFKNPSSNIS